MAIFGSGHFLTSTLSARGVTGCYCLCLWGYRYHCHFSSGSSPVPSVLAPPQNVIHSPSDIRCMDVPGVLVCHTEEILLGYECFIGYELTRKDKGKDSCCHEADVLPHSFFSISLFGFPIKYC